MAHIIADRPAAEAGVRNSTRREAADLALQRMDVLAKIGQGIPAEAISSGLTSQQLKNSMRLNRQASQDALVNMGLGAVSGVAGAFSGVSNPSLMNFGRSASTMFQARNTGQAIPTGTTGAGGASGFGASFAF